MKKDFKKYPISNIQEEVEQDGVVWIDFTIEETNYDLEVVPSKEGYLPKLVYHKETEDQQNCPFCYGTFMRCTTLSEQNEALLKHLIEQPVIRLRWLMENRSLSVKND